MTTHTNLLVRAGTILAGLITAFGGLFMTAAPAFADYGNYYYPPQGTAGIGNVCTNRFDPFCMTKEANYLNYQSQYYNPYQYGNYGYPDYDYNYGYPNYQYGYTQPYSYSNSYQYQYCYGTGCAQPMNYGYNNYQPMNYGYNSSPYNYGYNTRY